VNLSEGAVNMNSVVYVFEELLRPAWRNYPGQPVCIYVDVEEGKSDHVQMVRFADMPRDLRKEAPAVSVLILSSPEAFCFVNRRCDDWREKVQVLVDHLSGCHGFEDIGLGELERVGALIDEFGEG
jgi:hypothetical protein